ncbi:MAG: hypothetical protein WCP29_05945 [Acidobacteriota bacterium]
MRRRQRQWCVIVGTAVMLAGAGLLGRTSPGSERPRHAQTVPQSTGSPSSKADLKPVVADDRLLNAPPVVTIGPDGTGDVAFDTAIPTPACRVYVGTLVPSTVLDTPFFPVSVRESISEPALSHRVKFDVRRLETWLPAADAPAVREGDLYVRLELYDSRTATARYFERRVHVAVASGRYEQRTTLLSGPVVDQVTTTSALVSWNADAPVAGVVELWSGDARRKIGEFPTSAPGDHPVVKVVGLTAGTSYQYRVRLSDSTGKGAVNTGRRYSFATAPPAGGSFAFMFMSDGRASAGGGFANFNGVNAEVTVRLLADGYRRGSRFALFGGDLASGYTSSVEHFRMMLDTWKLATDPVAHNMPIYEGFGNHESLHDFYVDGKGARYSTDKLGEHSSEGEFAARFVNPENGPEAEVRDGVVGPPYKGTVYSFDYGNSHFVMLNLDYWFTVGGPARDPGLAWKLLGGNREGYIMANQLAWLDRDLAAARARGVANIFVAGHEPVFPLGGHVADSMWWGGLDDAALPSGDVRTMRTQFLATLSRYGVIAIMVGHEHVYGRMVIDANVDPQVRKPITQFVSGGAGAPFYAKDESVPWAKAVNTFAPVNHYLMFTVTPTGVSFEAVDLDGRVFDKGVLR